MAPGTILWIGLLAVLAVLLVVTLRRVSALVRRTRDLERFQHQGEALGARLAAASGPLVRDLDALRRRAGDPDAIRAGLPATRAELERLAAEGRDLRPPAGLGALAGGMISELDRAVRAGELVDHGLVAMADARGGREMEAQTALKRGTLNLRHATEAFERILTQGRAVRPADLAAGAPPIRVPGGGAQATWSGDDADDPWGASDPTM
jgi:hypothetical protein